MVAIPADAYSAAYARSLDDPETFWLGAAEAIDWDVVPTRALDHTARPVPQWFPDGVLNTSFNALDRHVRDGRGDQPALIHESTVTGTSTTFSYRELRDQVATFAGVLAASGVSKGDRVLIYLPMIPAAVIAMLACARLGAVHCVVFGGFAAHELAVRIDDCTPKVLVTAAGSREPRRSVEYVPLVVRALAAARHTVQTVIVKERPEVPGTAATGRSGAPAATWLDWDAAMAHAVPHDPVPVAATDPLYILYTSGTTGTPKGVVRDNGGHAVAMTWSLRNVYGIAPGEVIFTGSDVGWVVGHSYIVYAPLLGGATTVLYEGKPVGTPDAGAFWRIVRDHGVDVLFTAPTALRAIRRADPRGEELGRYDTWTLRALFVAGERLDPETFEWATQTLVVPVVDHWWQTETGWAICANPLGLHRLPIKAGSPSLPMPGFDVRVVDPDGQVLPALAEGRIVLKVPLPPGALTTIWDNEPRFVAGYLSFLDGYYLTGDSGYVDADGYLFVMGRTDDVINVAGHRLSTGAVEQIVARHRAVAECAVVGVADEIKGQVPVGFVVLTTDADIDDARLQQELVAMVRDQIGAVASFSEVNRVPALPKTRSGKLLRRTMRQIVDGEPYAVPATIDDVDALTSFAAAALQRPTRGPRSAAGVRGPRGGPH
jgi:propionyl-CoA synthetase